MDGGHADDIAAGRLCWEIAAKIGVGETTARRKAQALGFPPRRSNATPNRWTPPGRRSRMASTGWTASSWLS